MMIEISVKITLRSFYEEGVKRLDEELSVQTEEIKWPPAALSEAERKMAA